MTGSAASLKKLIVVLIALAGAYLAYEQSATGPTPVDTPVGTSVDTYVDRSVSADAKLERAFEQKLSDLQVQGSGTVARVLRDDNDGSRHQRFVLRLASGQSLMVAHNIDLAPRIENLRSGDSVAFFGEYEWNPQGGVIHWTHHDPAGRHVAGWLMHNGRRYQ